MKNQTEAKSSIRPNERFGVTQKVGRTISNMNSPKNKIPVTKGAGMAKSPQTINSKITNVKSERGNQQFESDISTQDPVAKSVNTVTSPTKKQIPTHTSTISHKQIPKPDYSKKQTRLGSPRNNFQQKDSKKKNPQENSAVPKSCKNCEDLKMQYEENQGKMEDMKKKIEQEFEEKNKQIQELETERKALKEKMAIYQDIVKKNKKLMKEQVSEFHGNGKQKEEYVNRIRELEDTVKKLEKEKEQRDIQRQKLAQKNQIKFPNMLEVESEFVSRAPLGVSELNYANLKEQSNIKDSNFNESSIYRMIHSKNSQSIMNNDPNQFDKGVLEKIKKQYEGSLGQICEQFEEKVKKLEDQVNQKYEEIISLREQVIVGNKQKEEFEAKLNEVTSSAQKLRKENSTLRQRITEYEEKKMKSGDCTESTLPSCDDSIQEEKRNLLKELCQQRRRNNRNCLNKLDRMKQIQEQQCSILSNFQAASRFMFNDFEELVQN